MIEKILPSTKSKLKILNYIYKNPGVNLSNIIKTLSVSPNFTLKYLNDLEENEVVKKTKSSVGKSVERKFSINFHSDFGLLLALILEKDNLLEFKEKYPFGLLKRQLESSLPKGSFVLIYGSYARFSPEKDSDIDIIVVGDKINKKLVKEMVVTLENPSIKIETKEQFLRNLSKPLYLSMLREHVILVGSENYLSLMALFLERRGPNVLESLEVENGNK